MVSPQLQFFLSMGHTDVLLDCVQIGHPNFSKTYYKCRNCDFDGIDLLHENGQTVHYDYYPLSLSELADENDLDAGFRIDFGDLGEVLPFEVDNVQRAGGMLTKPTVVYRGYKSTDLTGPLLGPISLEATSFAFDKDGASFEASAPYLNNTKTGETYNPTRFPMLRGFLV